MDMNASSEWKGKRNTAAPAAPHRHHQLQRPPCFGEIQRFYFEWNESATLLWHFGTTQQVTTQPLCVLLRHAVTLSKITAAWRSVDRAAWKRKTVTQSRIPRARARARGLTVAGGGQLSGHLAGLALRCRPHPAEDPDVALQLLRATENAWCAESLDCLL